MNNIDYDFLEFAEPDSRRRYQKDIIEQESSFKAWQADSLMPQNNIDLLRNFKSQLVHYQQRYKNQNSNGVSVRLPSLQKLKRKITQKSTNSIQLDTCGQPLTQRNNKQNKKKAIILHKSIQLNRQSSKTLKSQKQNRTLTHKNQKKNTMIYSKQQSSIPIAKVHQMRFQQNANKQRIRKRDIYLSIFGERGKHKVQKLTFHDENKPQQIYVENKNFNKTLRNQKNQKNQEKTKQNYNLLRYKLKTKQSNNDDMSKDLFKSTAVMRF